MQAPAAESPPMPPAQASAAALPTPDAGPAGSGVLFPATPSGTGKDVVASGGAGSRSGTSGPDGATVSAARSSSGFAPASRGVAKGADSDDAGTGGVRGAPGPLRERIQSRVVYPEEAIRREQEGEVLLRVHVGPAGIPDVIRTSRSSGIRLLDDAARRGVVRAAPLPSSPGWYEVPVRFSLR
jgi:protein TonB